MKHDLIQKILFCILCAAGIVIMDFVCVRFLSAKELNLKEVPVAAHDIDPRSEITEGDYILQKVSGAYLMDNACQSPEEIIGKYTDLQGTIPEGSPFYKSMLEDAENLPDHPVLQLLEGEAVYTCAGSNTDFGVLSPGLRADIHLSAVSGQTPVTGILIEHARILSVKDHQGISIDSKESSGTAWSIEIAVQKEDLDILTLAETSGQLRFFASSDSYQDEEAVLCSDSAAVQYLENLKMMQVNEKVGGNS